MSLAGRQRGGVQDGGAFPRAEVGSYLGTGETKWQKCAGLVSAHATVSMVPVLKNCKW